MIVTLTPNPSLDRTIEIDELRSGEVQRALSSRVEAGGKGVNVSRCLASHGASTVAVVPAGGSVGVQLAELLAPSGVPVVTVPLSGATRSNVALVEPDGTTTKINEPGPEPTDAEVAMMADRVVGFARSASWVVLSGSLPSGVPGQFYADVIERVHEKGVKVALDTSGAALEASVAASPDLIKPNDEELAELTGAELRTWGDVVEQAQRLREQGVGAVLVSLGPDGALLVDDTGTHRAYSEPVEVRSTVAAGDSTLSGYLLALTRGGDSVEALRTAVAFGAAAVTLPGSGMPGPDDFSLDAVTVEENPDLSRRLGG